MAHITIEPGRLNGIVDAPPSKSDSHRAILLSALSRGKSVIGPVMRSDDVNATLNAVRSLGVDLTLGPKRLTINGGLHALSAPLIDCKESGSTLRFLLPVVLAAGMGARFVGRGRLGQRPMEPYERICHTQRLTYELRDGLTLDLKVGGQLKPGRFELPGNVSSQFVSGLLMALPLLDGESKIVLTGALESRGYVDMTLSTMRAFGVDIQWSGNTLAIPSNARYRSCDYCVSGDYSQAAVFLCAAALGHDVRVRGLSPVSTQPDQAVLTHLMRMGASVREQGGETSVSATELNGTTIDVSQCPDIAPILALTAALAQGTTRIVNGERLRLKESDRIESTCRTLNALGAQLEPTADGMVIEGVPALRGGVAIDCANDHRIAMMLAIAALHADGPVLLTGVECLKKSYPEFLDDFAELGGVINGR